MLEAPKAVRLATRFLEEAEAAVAYGKRRLTVFRLEKLEAAVDYVKRRLHALLL